MIEFVAKRLDRERHEGVERHLAECAACRELVSATVRGDLITGWQHADPALAATMGAPTTERDPIPAGAAIAIPVLARGTAIGRYIVLSLLGRGGMGVVYRAIDPDLNRQVAIKVVALRELADDAREQARQRLMREAQALAKLSHPNVVAVHDVGLVGDDVFVAMELVEGETLRSWLAESVRSPREILRVFRAAGDGLAAAHRVGVVHRDFKPDNVMVGSDGRVRVLDFGLARLGETAARASRRSLPTVSTSSELTLAGTVLGTPAYMSPEQDAGLDAEPASDQFSFCVALYEALFGRLPHRGDSYGELATSRADGAIALPPKRRGVPSRTRRAVLIGLRPSPLHRHASLDALIGELRPVPWSSPRAIAVAALATLAIGAGASWLVLRSSPAEAGPQCDFVAGEVARRWNPAKRARLAVAFAGHADAAAQVSEAIDRWTGEWAMARTKLCEQPQQAPDDTKDKLDCLQHRMNELEGALIAFTELGQASVDRAPQTMSRLRPVEECAGVPSSEPTDEVKQAAMPILRLVVEARQVQNAGKLDDAIAKANEAVALGKKIHSPAVSVAWQTLGEAQSAHGDLDDARASLRQAAIASAEIHEEGMVADAWLALVAVSFIDRKLDDNVRSALFAAELATTQLRENDARKALFHYTVATIDTMEGKFSEAKHEAETALHIFETIGIDANLASVLAVENTLGMASMELGDFANARVHLERAEALMRKAFGDTPVLGRVLNNQAFLAAYQEHYADAEQLMLRAVDLLRKFGSDHSLVGEEEFNLGQLYALWGRCDRATPHLARARTVLTHARGADSPMLAMLTIEDERCGLAKDPRGAVERLGRAREIAVAHPVTIHELPELDFVLAQALARTGNRTRARELAADARAKYASQGAGTAARVRAIDRWLAGK